MSAYLRRLTQEKEASVPAPSASPLEVRFLEWFDSLPPIRRGQAFSMQEIEQALKAPGRLISAVLLKHGWVRKRRWVSRDSYVRYWQPPILILRPQNISKS